MFPNKILPAVHVLVRMKFLNKSFLSQLLCSPLRQADEVGAKEEEKDDWFNVDGPLELKNPLLHSFLLRSLLSLSLASVTIDVCNACVLET